MTGDEMSLNKSLSVSHIDKYYTGVQVLHSVSFTVPAGKVVGLIGENGAGKSTISSIIAGVVQPDGGQMTIDGEPYAPETPAQAISSGVALIHQEIRMVQELSVAENIFLGQLPMKNGRVDSAKLHKDSREVLTKLGVDINPARKVRGLSIATQQSIEIAKAISRSPRYVIFDEPSASLTPHETEQVLQQIKVLCEHGAGVIYISHRLEEVLLVASEIICLRDGHVAKAWKTKQISTGELVKAMVGRDFRFEHHAPVEAGENEVVLEVRDLSRASVFEGINFTVSKGEVLGIAGLVGAGRTELVRAIAGVDRATSGEIFVNGKKIKVHSPADAIKEGIVMVPEDRKGQGLNLEQTGAQNIASPWEHILRKTRLVTNEWMKNLAETTAKAFDVRGSIHQPVASLSGGNQQKILLAKWLVREPKVLILDEPTRGVDVGAKMAIYQIIRDAAARGAAVVVVSSELEEILGVSNRVLVMSRGRQQKILSRSEATAESVMTLAMPMGSK
jgi:ribose transport system ATP-binding protein